MGQEVSHFSNLQLTPQGEVSSPLQVLEDGSGSILFMLALPSLLLLAIFPNALFVAISLGRGGVQGQGAGGLWELSRPAAWLGIECGVSSLPSSPN